ncbi:MAG: hypothetical protein IKT33_01900, partial [Clostridia bacterium]|nr:hypothetical protein [Clostridia bacterium]
AKTGLFYTGGKQTLFTGAGHIYDGTSVDQSIEYGYSTLSSAAEPISDTVTTDLSALQAQDGWTSATEQIKYFLWYRLTESENCSGTDWAKVKDANNADVFATIGKASLSIALNLTPARDYNAQNFSVFAKAPTLTSTSTALTSHYTVTYKVTKTYVDGARVLVNEYIDSAYANANGIAACEIKVQAKWSLKDTVTGTAAYQYATQSSFKDLANNTTEIRQISAASVTVSGFTHSNLKLSANSSSVSCTPYSDVAVDLKVLGYAQNNGITTNNTIMTDDGTEPYNKLSYILTQSDTAPSTGYTPYTTAEALNEAIKARTVNIADDWYLWFRVDRHMNLITGSTFLGDSFTVTGFDDVDLTGLTMSGATSDIKAGTVTYSGSPYKLAAGAIKPVQAVELGTIYYGLADAATTSARPTEWTDDLSTLQVTAAKDTPYYLWVKWEASSTVAASNGVVYGSLQVNPYTAAAENLEFTGLSFSDWGTPDPSHVFSKPFTNGWHAVATKAATTPTVIVTNAQIESNEFGTLTFAVGNETAAST